MHGPQLAEAVAAELGDEVPLDDALRALEGAGREAMGRALGEPAPQVLSTLILVGATKVSACSSCSRSVSLACASFCVR